MARPLSSLRPFWLKPFAALLGGLATRERVTALKVRHGIFAVCRAQIPFSPRPKLGSQGWDARAMQGNAAGNKAQKGKRGWRSKESWKTTSSASSPPRPKRVAGPRKNERWEADTSRVRDGPAQGLPRRVQGAEADVLPAWQCERCGFLNWGGRSVCYQCQDAACSDVLTTLWQVQKSRTADENSWAALSSSSEAESMSSAAPSTSALATMDMEGLRELQRVYAQFAADSCEAKEVESAIRARLQVRRPVLPQSAQLQARLQELRHAQQMRQDREALVANLRWEHEALQHRMSAASKDFDFWTQCVHQREGDIAALQRLEERAPTAEESSAEDHFSSPSGSVYSRDNGSWSSAPHDRVVIESPLRSGDAVDHAEKRLQELRDEMEETASLHAVQVERLGWLAAPMLPSEQRGALFLSHAEWPPLRSKS